MNNQQMAGWVDKLNTNIDKFLIDTNKNKKEKLEFIQSQYQLFNTINLVLNGKAFFIGCSFSSLKQNKEIS